MQVEDVAQQDAFELQPPAATTTTEENATTTTEENKTTTTEENKTTGRQNKNNDYRTCETSPRRRRTEPHQTKPPLPPELARTCSGAARTCTSAKASPNLLRHSTRLPNLQQGNQVFSSTTLMMVNSVGNSNYEAQH